MKRELVIELIRKIKAKPNLKRKLKIFVLIGLVGFIFTCALTIWAGLTAFNYVALKANELAHSPIALTQVENLKTELKALPKLQSINCWASAQSLMNIQPWLERTVIDNLITLKVACLNDIPKN